MQATNDKPTTSTPVKPPRQVFNVPRLNDLGARLLERYRSTFVSLANFESRFLSESMAAVDVESPIFVCGLARSGTTVLLEMLSRHPHTASQRYLDFPFVFTPYWWNRYLALAAAKSPAAVERSHQDGLMVSATSPEAMEEPLWMHFFPQSHNPAVSNVLDEDVSYREFETFYRNHMAKLLTVRNRSRYLAKGNYHLARIGYLHHCFPTASFVIPVRDPVHHIASSIKQHRLFTEGQQQSDSARRYLQQVGHFEFGLDRVPMNVDEGRTERILALWNQGEEVRGWAEYWSMVHDFLADRLEQSPALSDRVMLVSYDSFCESPAEHATSIREHCGLAEDAEYLQWATDHIRAPSYYQHGFTEEEVALIREITNESYTRCHSTQRTLETVSV